MPQSDRSTLLREPNFRWMMGGSLISALGDQFTMVALPWLFLGAGLFLAAYSLLAFACTNISRIADPASTA